MVTTKETTLFTPFADKGTKAETATPVVESSVAPVKKQVDINALLSTYKPPSQFSSFCVMPTNVRFHTQEEGEDIILLLRRHPVTNVPWIIITIILLFLPFIGLPFFSSGGIIAFLDQISTGLLPALLAFWYLFITGYVLLNFFFWYFNVNIVTNRRVLDFDFFYLLYREFSEALLDRIEDVTATGGGILSVIFDYGNVDVQTAATNAKIEFDRVPKPQEVVNIITNLIQAKKDKLI